ncbi:response regulator [Porphyrobacter sp. YT40]|uniref:response regulator n=1 Tax=Porphyrobacter sp. YT40 TaxID=2547601 RepID=UPI001144FABF|nr:response regulator [Porphyrobacter sp. YT40]QDH33608.1 response regulator [Porphyrobacter sp. YT40]
MEHAPARPQRILVVEDHLILAMQTASVLTSMGCHVVGPITSLSDAIAVVGLHPVDAAVLDFDIGGEPVIPLARLLDESGTPYIICTGTPDQARGALGLPPERIMEKPVFRPRLEERLRTLLDS